jgi:UPF0042 nucleotide-binding protein
LIPKFAELLHLPGNEMNKVALGVDIRSGNSFGELEQVLIDLDTSGFEHEILFLECIVFPALICQRFPL